MKEGILMAKEQIKKLIVLNIAEHMDYQELFSSTGGQMQMSTTTMGK